MKRLLTLILAGLIGFAAAHTASAATPTTIKGLPSRGPLPARDGHRFLFVVDVSSSMRGMDLTNRQALFDLIFTGLYGQMRTGDTFGLWLFNDGVRAGEFPMQVWEETNSLAAASLAGRYLREQKYSGKPRPDVLVPRLLNLVKSVRDVDIIILSSGSKPIEGTPFDAALAAVFEQRKDERRREDKPFITALVARGGAITNAMAVIAGEYVQLPERSAPALAKAAPISVPLARTPAEIPPPTVSVTLQPPLPAVPPPQAKNFQIVSRTNNAPSTNVVAASLPPTSPPPETIRVVMPPVTNAEIPAPTLAPVVVSTSLPSPFESLPSPAMAVSAREPAAENPPSKQAPTPISAVVAPPAAYNPVLLIAIGGLLLAACFGLLLLVLRRSRPASQSSYITQSMSRH